MKGTKKNIHLGFACLTLAASMPTMLHAQAAGAAAVQDSKEIALDAQRQLEIPADDN